MLTSEEWEKSKNNFDMGIDHELLIKNIVSSEAKVNYDSITGTICIPNKHNFEKKPITCAFALDEKAYRVYAHPLRRLYPYAELLPRRLAFGRGNDG